VLPNVGFVGGVEVKVTCAGGGVVGWVVGWDVGSLVGSDVGWVVGSVVVDVGAEVGPLVGALLGSAELARSVGGVPVPRCGPLPWLPLREPGPWLWWPLF
jgi:hypothetical protein